MNLLQFGKQKLENVFDLQLNRFLVRSINCFLILLHFFCLQENAVIAVNREEEIFLVNTNL